jgi:zona occludens toxin
MQTLFTGIPGAGKTAAAVDLLLALTKKDPGRPLYVIEIPEPGVERLQLKLPHTLIGPDAAKPEHRDPALWPEIVPDGAFLFMPEAQRFWPARSPSARVPAHVEAVGQHRHRGIDLVLDTQDPKLLDDKVRLRTGRHVHLRDLGILGRFWYEWPECGDPRLWKGAPIKVRYRLPKRVFGLYKSASLHVPPVRKFPPVLLLLLLLVPLLGFLGYRVWTSIASKGAPPSVVAPGAAPSPGPGGTLASSFGARGGSVVPAVPVGAELVAAMVPRLSHDPGSAPLYDHLRVVQDFPRVVGGWCIGKRCRCWNQQGFDAGLSSAQCRQHVEAPAFNPFLKTVLAGGAAQRGTQSPGSPGAQPLVSAGAPSVPRADGGL